MTPYHTWNTHTPLLIDQYQLVMAQGYWQLKMSEQEVVFHMFFRHHPIKENYTIVCGLAHVIEFINQWHFSSADIDYLRTLKTPAKTPIFSEPFLQYLRHLRFSGDIDAIPEGTVAFPNAPVLRIKAPILQCQLLETALTNAMQFSSLIATRAAQLCHIASPDPVIEFGLRRSQGPNGGLMASRAAYMGGCASVSNVLAGQYYDIPVQGTQAHSWVMAFPDELTAFEKFAEVSPNNMTLLVDTYHTIQGVKNAIKVGKKLREKGYELQAIRLDSGDLLSISREARKLLDEAGLKSTKILASGDLDDQMIAQLKAENAPIDLWGVGTRLVTSYDKPALDMVYKLAAIKNNTQEKVPSPSGRGVGVREWEYKIKISDSPEKTTIPGILQTRRYFNQKHFVGDVLYDELTGIDDKDFKKTFDAKKDLLEPIFRHGKLVYQQPTTASIRDYCIVQRTGFLASKQKHYNLQLEPGLEKLRKKLLTR